MPIDLNKKYAITGSQLTKLKTYIDNSGGGGGIKTLTSADFNYNYNTGKTTNPNCIAAWLLPADVYLVKGIFYLSMMHYQGTPSAFLVEADEGNTVLIREGRPMEPVNEGEYYNDYHGSSLLLNKSTDLMSRRAYWYPANDALNESFKTIFGKTKRLNSLLSDPDAFAVPIAADSLASDTPFGGATGIITGSKGLVPAPAAGKQNTYLKGNGTWEDWSQSDWEQSDSSENSYILHRPFYEDTVEQKTIYPVTEGEADYNQWNADANFRNLISSVVPSSIGVAYFGMTNSNAQNLITAMGNNTEISIDEFAVTVDDWETGETTTYTFNASGLTFTQDQTYTGDAWFASGNLYYKINSETTVHTVSGAGFFLAPKALAVEIGPNDYGLIIMGPDPGTPMLQSQTITPTPTNVIYSSSIITQTKQIDPKFIPLDENVFEIVDGKITLKQ